MLSRKVFSDMRRAGMGVGVSKAKLSEAMLEVLLRLPTASTDGLLGGRATLTY